MEQHVPRFKIPNPEYYKAIGISEGIEKGIKEATRKFVLQMMNNHLPFEQISKYTGLPPEDVRRIAEQM